MECEMICFHKSQLRNRENIPKSCGKEEERSGLKTIHKWHDNPSKYEKWPFSVALANVDFSCSLLSVVWNQDVASEHLEKRPFNPLLVLMTILDHSKPNPFSWPSAHPNLWVKFKTPTSIASMTRGHSIPDPICQVLNIWRASFQASQISC